MNSSCFKLNKIQSFNIFIILILISGLDQAFEVLRHLKYFLVPVSILLLFSFKTILIGSVKPFFSLLVFGFIISPTSTTEGLKDWFFITTYSVPFLFFSLHNINVRKLFCGVAIIYIIGLIFSGIGEFKFSLIDSESSLESHSFSFVFGLFCIYFLLKKDLLYLVISIVLSVLVLKRISLLAVALCLIVVVIPPLVQRAILNRLVLISMNVVYVFFCYYITTDSFNDVVMEYVGVSSAYFTMGRSVFYAEIFGSDWSAIHFIFGHGMGAATDVLKVVAWDEKILLHNDILKILYDFGVIVTLLFLVLLYSGTNREKVLALYLNVIFLTDNVLVYVFVMFFYLLLSSQLEIESYCEDSC